MGGYGSGRQFYYGAKATTSSYLNIDIRRWKREKLLAPNNSFARQWQCDREIVASIQVDVASDLSYVTLRYRNKEHGQDWKSFNYQVPITWIECNLGGRRPWFMCPIRGCGRRVALVKNINYSVASGQLSVGEAEKLSEFLSHQRKVIKDAEWKQRGGG